MPQLRWKHLRKGRWGREQNRKTPRISQTQTNYVYIPAERHDGARSRGAGPRPAPAEASTRRRQATGARNPSAPRKAKGTLGNTAHLPPALIGADCACAPRRRAAPEVLTWRPSPSPGPGSPCSAPGGTCPALLFPPPRRGPGALGLGGSGSVCRRLKHREGLLGLAYGVGCLRPSAPQQRRGALQQQAGGLAFLGKLFKNPSSRQGFREEGGQRKTHC